MKKKVFLTKAQRAAMKEECRIALEYPYKSHARGAAVHEIAERYNVGMGVVYDVMNTTHRAAAKSTNGTNGTNGTKPVSASAAPVVPPAPVVGYALLIGGVQISAPSKEALLDVVARLLEPTS